MPCCLYSISTSMPITLRRNTGTLILMNYASCFLVTMDKVSPCVQTTRCLQKLAEEGLNPMHRVVNKQRHSGSRFYQSSHGALKSIFMPLQGTLCSGLSSSSKDLLR